MDTIRDKKTIANKSIVLAVLTGGCLLIGQAQSLGATLRLSATSRYFNTWSDFFVLWNDKNNNKVLDVSEISLPIKSSYPYLHLPNFSGSTYFYERFDITLSVYNTVFQVPEIPMITSGFAEESWGFSGLKYFNLYPHEPPQDVSDVFPTVIWSYKIEQWEGGGIPIPESTSILSLLALGTLGAVATIKRKMK